MDNYYLLLCYVVVKVKKPSDLNRLMKLEKYIVGLDNIALDVLCLVRCRCFASLEFKMLSTNKTNSVSVNMWNSHQ